MKRMELQTVEEICNMLSDQMLQQKEEKIADMLNDIYHHIQGKRE